MAKGGFLNIIIYAPAYNVEKSIEELIKRTYKALLQIKNAKLKSFIIVNDGSIDKTKEILERLKKEYSFLMVFNRNENKGVVETILHAMSEAKKLGKNTNTIFIRMDTDLEHQPEDFMKVLAPIIKRESELCIGYLPIDFRNGFFFKIFNRNIGIVESKRFLGVNIPQFCPGFYAIKQRLFEKILFKLKENTKKYKTAFKKEMITMDFVTFVIAKQLGSNISVVKLSPIEEKYIKKQPLKKVLNY